MYVIKNDLTGEILDFAFFVEERDEKLETHRSKAAEPEDINDEWRDAEASILLEWMCNRPERFFEFNHLRTDVSFLIYKRWTGIEWKFELNMGPINVQLTDLRASYDERQLWADNVIIDVSDLDVVE